MRAGRSGSAAASLELALARAHRQAAAAAAGARTALAVVVAHEAGQCLQPGVRSLQLLLLPHQGALPFQLTHNHVCGDEGRSAWARSGRRRRAGRRRAQGARGPAPRLCGRARRDPTPAPAQPLCAPAMLASVEYCSPWNARGRWSTMHRWPSGSPLPSTRGTAAKNAMCGGPVTYQRWRNLRGRGRAAAGQARHQPRHPTGGRGGSPVSRLAGGWRAAGGRAGRDPLPGAAPGAGQRAAPAPPPGISGQVLTGGKLAALQLPRQLMQCGIDSAQQRAACMGERMHAAA